MAEFPKNWLAVVNEVMIDPRKHVDTCRALRIRHAAGELQHRGLRSTARAAHAEHGLWDAIDYALQAGGGTVFVPPGIFLPGSLVLRSFVTLYLQTGAVLRGSTDVNDYEYPAGPPTGGRCRRQTPHLRAR